MAAIASYRAAPSIFTVAPSGKTNLLMRGSTLLFSSRQRMVVGRVAALKERINSEGSYWCYLRWNLEFITGLNLAPLNDVSQRKLAHLFY